MEENYKTQFLQSIFGAHSITKTIINHYNLLQEDEDDESKLLGHMTNICEEEHIPNKDHLGLLAEIFNRLAKYRANREVVISYDYYQSTAQTCQTYVNWVFNSFSCFTKGDDGRFYYTSS